MSDQKKTLLAFIDVLGFSELVKRDDFGKYFEDYTKIIQESIEYKGNSSIDYVVFSDTIIIICKNNKERDLIDLIEIASIFSYRALTELKLPVKGCITFDKITNCKNENRKDVVIAGPGIVEAYHFEQKQNWVGIILSPNLIRDFYSVIAKCVVGRTTEGRKLTKTLKENYTLNFSVQKYRKIPFKTKNENTQNFEGYALIPHSFSSICAEHIQEDLDNYYQSLYTEKVCAIDTSIQEKYNNSINYILAVLCSKHTQTELDAQCKMTS